ncbi:TonB-dependent siderophore receptor [Sphingobium sp. WCS2017Hpa-17]|uniref:TonB-dependent siderophore receptor n=1 Tax=Sphingobium sp. WCS2017Hpa-17 TaxID=3073638 RepID=UPI00288C2015|nr:TonB-dependent siderophore receptor [Sphingobium sp. WCS2017Hpa-17]
MNNGRWFRAHKAACLALLLTSAAALPSAPAQAQGRTTRDFDIATQPLPDAIILFGRQAGIEVSAESSVTRGRRTPGVSGNLAPAEALSRLLSGTGLTFRWLSSRSVMVEAAPDSADGTVQLGPVRVEGATSGGGSIVTSDANATEGDSSYVARAMGTATGLSLSPRQTPQSVSIVTRAQLDNEAAVSINDALAHATGVKINEGEYFGTAITIRGFDITTIQVNGANVNFPQQPGAAQQDMAIYDRVEVLRGVAGLTQGSGKPGGTVNLVRKMPTLDHQANLLVRGGSWDNYRVEADVSGALSEDGHLRARIVGAWQDKDSFIDYVNETKRVAYGVVQADLGSSTMVSIGADWAKATGTPESMGYPRYTDGGALELPRSTFFGAAWNRRDSETTTAFVEVEQQLGGDWKAKLVGTGIWTSLFNRRMFVSGQAVYRDTGTGPLVRATQLYYDARQSVADLQVDGPLNLLGGRHELVFGANFQKVRGVTSSDTLDAPWYGSTPDMLNFDPLDYSFPTITKGTSRTTTRTQQGGVYGLARMSVLNDVKLFAGLRVNWWKTATETLSPTLTTRSGFKSSAQLLPYGGLTWDVRPGTTLYASYTDIYEAQNVIDRNGNLLDPIVGANYEIGVKQGFADDKLLLTASLFRISQSNRAIDDLTGPTPCPSTGNDYCSVAGGKVRNQGGEVELAGQLAKGWQATIGYTLTDTKYVNGPNGGQRFTAYQPRHLVKLSTAYDLGGGLDWLTLGGSATWQSRHWVEVQAMPGFEMAQKPYALVDLMARAKLGDALSLSVNLNNVFDLNYYKYLSHERAYNYVGAPRNVLVTLQGKF